MLDYHATEILKCEKCEYTTTNSINLRAHKYDYSHGDKKDEDSSIRLYIFLKLIVKQEHLCS